ncbi:MAG: glycosyltransferase family 2 protein [Puniceicoccaceae bacterium]
MSRKKLSIICPAYNEEKNLPRLYESVTRLFQDELSAYDYEVLILDNRSEDATRARALEICEKDSRWKYLRYSRNFGFDPSITAGLDHAEGDAVITLLSDLQDPPEVIPEFVRLWEAGAEVVNGVVRERHDDSWLKSLGAIISYKLIYHLSESRITPGATEFRLLDRKVVLVLRQLREPDRYLRGLVNWVGFRRELVPYDRAPREGGRSSAGLVFCIKYALNAIICFSAKPLQLATYFGVLTTLVSLGLAIAYLLIYLFEPSFATLPPPGISTVVLLVLFGIGTQSFFLGLIGEYLARVYNQGKGRLLYIVAEKIGFEEGEGE